MQSEAPNAKNAPESPICRVLPYRPTPIGSMVWRVPISNPRSAREHLQAPLPLSPRPVLAPCSGFSFQLSAFQHLASLARRDRHFLHAGNKPERANAAQAPAPLGVNLRFDHSPFTAVHGSAGPCCRTPSWLRENAFFDEHRAQSASVGQIDRQDVKRRPAYGRATSQQGTIPFEMLLPLILARME